MKEAVKQWQQERNTCPDREIYRVDASHARAIGLPTLAAVCDALDQLRTANPLILREEMFSLLRSLLSVAVGEANERLLLHSDIRDGVPGVLTVPARLLERDFKPEASE